MAVVELRGIQKHFGDVKAVDGVDLAISKGELLVILGPSGCGKTTLMRMIAGLETPTRGEIVIGERVVTTLPPRDREIAMVFQSYALYPHLTVFDNIAFPLHAKKEPKNAIIAKVEEAAGTLSIEHLLHRKPRQLSGGERQRVALCRALVKEPQVLLLDEPLSNLDAKLRASARDELQRFQRRTGITTIFVTHDQVEAMGMGDRIVVMNKGRVRQVGTPPEVYHDSADTFVATFLGSPGMNILDRGNFLVGFRPEQFVPKEIANMQETLVTFPFEVTRVEYLGADQLIYGKLSDTAEESFIVAKLSSELHFPIAAENTYDFVVQQKQLQFFDKAQGTRIESQPI
ncbi:MAG TPA: ATP-binding cassette domain-containing protein [Anaerolineales bacterium]|nr:ATP-binding cassette domain-containing protein [Anaerolineales bacterium]